MIRCRRVELAVTGPILLTLVFQQVGSILEYTGRVANAAATLARDSLRSSPNAGKIGCDPRGDSQSPSGLHEE
jgi:hypothetical protein